MKNKAKFSEDYFLEMENSDINLSDSDYEDLSKFEKLSQEERCTWLQQQEDQIELLKTQCEQKSNLNKLKNLIREAKETLNKYNFGGKDQGLILENLLTAIQSSKLRPNSFQYNQIDHIIKNQLGNINDHAGTWSCLPLCFITSSFNSTLSVFGN